MIIIRSNEVVHIHNKTIWTCCVFTSQWIFGCLIIFMLILLCVNIFKSFQTLVFYNFHQGHYNSDLSRCSFEAL